MWYQFYLYLLFAKLTCILRRKLPFVENSGYFSVAGNCLRNSVASCNVTKPLLAFLKYVIGPIENTKEDPVKHTHFYNSNSTTVAVFLDKMVKQLLATLCIVQFTI